MRVSIFDLYPWLAHLDPLVPSEPVEPVVETPTAEQLAQCLDCHRELRELAEGIRADAEAHGFSPTAAEEMAVAHYCELVAIAYGA